MDNEKRWVRQGKISAIRQFAKWINDLPGSNVTVTDAHIEKFITDVVRETVEYPEMPPAEPVKTTSQQL